jgi:gamma-glutamylputrescine oxidase
LDAASEKLSYWQQPGDRTAGLPPVDTPDDTDVAIIGGGYAGLSTAVAVLQRRPGTRVLVLEREFLGFGASGRNGGLLSPVPAPVWLLTARANPDHAWALATLNKKVHTLGAWLADKVPDSEASRCTLQLQAAGRVSASGISRVAAVLERAGIAHDLAPDVRRNGTFAVSPYRLVRALGAYAGGLGAHICERAAVEAVKAAPGGAVIRLAGGRTVRARKVVLCTNAYTGSISTPSTPCSKVVRNYMLATEPLDRETQQRLGDGHSFVVELNRSYTFYRLHRGRIIFGGIETFFRRPRSDYDVPASIRSALERNLAKSLPWCRQLKVASDWGGAFQSSATDLPIIARARNAGAIGFNLGYGGTGVPLTQIFASHAAAMALDLPLADAEDQRLAEIVRATRMPLIGLAQFGIGVGWDVARRLALART